MTSASIDWLHKRRKQSVADLFGCICFIRGQSGSASSLSHTIRRRSVDFEMVADRSSYVNRFAVRTPLLSVARESVVAGSKPQLTNTPTRTTETRLPTVLAPRLLATDAISNSQIHSGNEHSRNKFDILRLRNSAQFIASWSISQPINGFTMRIKSRNYAIKLYTDTCNRVLSPS